MKKPKISTATYPPLPPLNQPPNPPQPRLREKPPEQTDNRYSHYISDTVNKNSPPTLRSERPNTSPILLSNLPPPNEIYLNHQNSNSSASTYNISILPQPPPLRKSQERHVSTVTNITRKRVDRNNRTTQVISPSDLRNDLKSPNDQKMQNVSQPNSLGSSLNTTQFKKSATYNLGHGRSELQNGVTPSRLVTGNQTTNGRYCRAVLPYRSSKGRSTNFLVQFFFEKF